MTLRCHYISIPTLTWKFSSIFLILNIPVVVIYTFPFIVHKYPEFSPQGELFCFSHLNVNGNVSSLCAGCEGKIASIIQHKQGCNDGKWFAIQSASTISLHVSCLYTPEHARSTVCDMMISVLHFCTYFHFVYLCLKLSLILTGHTSLKNDKLIIISISIRVIEHLDLAFLDPWYRKYTIGHTPFPFMLSVAGSKSLLQMDMLQ